MSKIRTGLYFRQFSFAPFPDSLDFGHFFLSEFQTLKIQMRQKVWISDRKSVWNPNFEILGTIYLSTSDNLLQSRGRLAQW